MVGGTIRVARLAIILCFASAGALLAAAGCRNREQKETRLPGGLQRSLEALQVVSSQIQGGKTPDEVYAVIRASFGDPVRDVGSGLSIEQWNLDEGVLTFHPITGPTFVSESGDVIHLIHTRNQVEENVLGSFEMTILPDRAFHHSRFWLGNLELRRDGRYSFEDSGQNLAHRSPQTTNLFLLHPSGTFEVAYPSSTGPEALLETLTVGTIVAKLTFSPEDGAASKVYSIATDPLARRLYFVGDETQEFEMARGWNRYWGD